MDYVFCSMTGYEQVVFVLDQGHELLVGMLHSHKQCRLAPTGILQREVSGER